MILYKDGRFYKGNWQNDLYHGRGILKMNTHKGSTVVEGSFDSGRFIGGICKAQYQNGEVYDGKMSAHMKREYKGVYYFNNGDRYDGDWVNDKRQGKGRLEFFDGGEFEGVFKDDEIYDGKLIDKNQNIFKNDLKKGGYFLRGKLTGMGTATFMHGDTYEGEFRDGVFSGKGKLTYRNLDSEYYEEVVYIGNFRNHKREGYGEMTWTVGKEQFKGWFKSDQRFKGTMTLSDGNIYEGEWQNDVFHG